jgi:heme-degrading monooxygenase HmoA
MIVLIVQHTVRDYDAWKPAFDEHESVRRQHGSTGHTVYRGVDNPNEVTVLSLWPSRQQAEAFAADPSLKGAMERGGVVSEPRVTMVEDAESLDYVRQRVA